MNKLTKVIPQVLAIVPISPDGKLKLKKAIKQYLGLDKIRKLYLDTDNEILLSAKNSFGDELSIDNKNQIFLPKVVLQKLGINKKELIALVEREAGLSIKSFTVAEEKGEWARLVDLETVYKVIRTVETNPMPELLLPRLVEKNKNFKLNYSIHAYLQNKERWETWLSRKLIGTEDKRDENLRQKLIDERLKMQNANGSWDNQVAITTRNLRELADLGLTRKDNEIRIAIDWLINRPQSRFNPGLWFATDELIEEQAEVIRRREQHKGKGPRERFNQRMATEVNLTRSGDPTVVWPCGPRIMWTTALVLEALLKLDCEQLDRVKLALDTLTAYPRWCDNSQQHGLRNWEDLKPISVDKIKRLKIYWINQYRYGGIATLKELEKADVSHEPFYLRRICQIPTTNGVEYPINMPDLEGGCTIIMIRALSQARRIQIKMLSEAWLWVYAGRQRSPVGSFSGHADKIFYDLQPAMLQIFASYDHTIAHLAILRSLPWILKNQNNDGSWGSEQTKFVSTLAVLGALRNVKKYLPRNALISE